MECLGKALTAYLVYYVSGSLAAGFLTAMVQVILELKLGDMFQNIYKISQGFH